MSRDEAQYTTEKEMVALLLEYGVSTSDARLAAELASHARRQALGAIYDVSKTCPPHLANLVAGLAIDSLAASLGTKEAEDRAIALMAVGIQLAAGRNFKVP